MEQDNTFRPTKRPDMPTRKFSDVPENFMPTPHQSNNASNIPENLPPVLQYALQKSAEKSANAETPSTGPKLAFTGNPKVDSILETIKNITHQYGEVEFPSKGKFYDGNVAPNNGVIHVRPMTGEEQEIIGTHRFMKNGQAINMIFSNCVRETIQPENLLVADRTWLLIYLRGISHGNFYEVQSKCSECGVKSDEVIDLDTINVRRCPDDYNPANLFDTLPVTKFKVRYRLPTGRDEILISDYRDKRAKNDARDDTWSYRASLLISDLEGITDQATIQGLIPRLPIQDSSYLRELLIDPPFGADTKIQMRCDVCGEEYQIELPFDINFFYPRQKKTKHTRV